MYLQNYLHCLRSLHAFLSKEVMWKRTETENDAFENTKLLS